MRARGVGPRGAGLTALAVRRLFVAVDPPAEARADLSAALDSVRGLPGEPRWTLPERWHLTLLFLGAVPDRQVPDLIAALAPEVVAAPPGPLRLAGAGRFGSTRRPQVAWIGLEGDVATLTDLARRLAVQARRLRLEVEERPFRPHLTVGRWRPGRPADGAVIDRLAGYRGPEWPVREVRLLESHLGPKPTYDELSAWSL